MRHLHHLLFIGALGGGATPLGAQAVAPRPPAPGDVSVQWDRVTNVARTTPSLQVVVNPPLRRGSPIHDNVFQSLRALQAAHVRYVPWRPYPRLGVAELEPPANGRTSWDFTHVDPLTIDFLDATRGHPVTLNFSTIPQWMWTTDRPVPYPADPDAVAWDYTQGTAPRDTTMKEIAGYYARLLAWYTSGGFTDEVGKRHDSGHHYDISHWEVLNEPDLEHRISPRMYTRLYDESVDAMRKVSPRTRFGGISLAFPGVQPDYFTYFLDPAHHKPGIPIDFITYHFYATSGNAPAATWPALFFTQADQFLTHVKWIEAIRRHLSPATETFINEVGTIAGSRDSAENLPDYYWNLSGAVYAYLFGELSRLGIDAVHESQLVGYPTQYPAVSMVDWTTGKGNARYWVLKLIRDNFAPGDRIVAASVAPAISDATVDRSGYTARLGDLTPYVYAVLTKDGKRRVLVVNRQNAPRDVTVPGAGGGTVEYVDRSTALDPPATRKLGSDRLSLAAFAVAAVTLP
ncbi:MAG: hypothetical protein NVS1B4_15310 [Gemmatimonadaceae bacterium]